jgi:hypothetical protein
MPNRDSWPSALAPRLSPKARGLFPRELRLQAFPPQPAISRRCSSRRAGRLSPRPLVGFDRRRALRRRRRTCDARF